MMGRLNIVRYPDPVLLKKAAPVDRITPEMQPFIEEMAELMYNSNGVGLAAPQVGISLRLIVVDIGDGLQVLANPQILSREGEQTGVEGCLSFPNLHGDVTRANKVTVRGVNRRGKKVQFTGEGFWARAMQHEIDHLDGVLFIDRVNEGTLHWVTGEADEDGSYTAKPTSLAEAKAYFEKQALLRA